MPEVQIGPFPGGIDNRQPATSLADGYCRDAVNMNVDATGRYQTRLGHNKGASLVHGVNLFACPLGRFAVQRGTLYREISGSYTAILPGLSGVCAFEYALGKLWFCV
jgi:hypothetical protein